MSGSHDASTTPIKKERSDDMEGEERESGEAKNNGNGNGKSKGKGKGNKGGKGGKGNNVKEAVENHVRDGSPVHAPDAWDGLRNAWAVAVEISQQSAQGGQETHQNQNDSQRQRQQNNHPNGQQSRSASASKRGRGGGVNAAQKRKVTENATNGTTGTDDGDRRRPPKRPKNDAARPHPEFWHPDGSVIIQVEDTKFKLHQSTLQKKSAYFAAAFQAKGKQKRGGRAYLEVEIDERSPNGHHLPVYRVAETTMLDFEALMRVVEEPMKYVDEILSMSFLAHVLRAARALSFQAQRIWAERILERMWPVELDSLTTDPIPHAAVALALARTSGLRGVQKRTSYELLRMPTFGQAIVAAPAADAEGKNDSRADADADTGTDLDELPREDLLRLLHAREQLVLAWGEIAGSAPTDFVCPRGTLTQFVPKSGGGETKIISSCASADADRVHARWVELVHTSGMYVQRMVDPLMGLQDLMEIPWREEGFCKKCVAAKTNVWDEFRTKLWDGLDVWLQLTDAEDA